MRLNVNTPCSGWRLILLLLHFLAEPLTAAKPVAALHSSFVFRYDCSDSFLKEGREPQGHAVNLDQGSGEGETERGGLCHNNVRVETKIQVFSLPLPTFERLFGV